MESKRKWPFSRLYIFHAHVLYHKVLVSLQSSALSLVISRKNNKVGAFLLRNTLREVTFYALPVKVLIPN